LLSAAHGAPLQTWDVGERTLIHIGRASECDVVISNPVVSRSHAYLRRDELGWQLSVISQNGVFMNGERIQGARLFNGSEFRLAATGPFLRFCQETGERSSLMQTVVPDDSTTAVLLLDVGKRDRQVDAIADAPYFQQLKQLARDLRDRNSK